MAPSKSKLSSCGLSTKLRYYETTAILRTVNSSVFDSVMGYSHQVRGQKQSNTFNDIKKPQIKAARNMCFKSLNQNTILLIKLIKN